MDAMKDALKKKMDGMKGKGRVAPEAMDVSADENEDGDEAPDLDAGGGLDHSDAIQDLGLMANAEQSGGAEALLQQILMALGDRGVEGRMPGSLGERASQGAQGKLAELAKGKMQG